MTEYVPLSSVVMEFISGLIAIIISIMLTFRWKERRKKGNITGFHHAIGMLTLSFWFQSLAPIVSSLGRLYNYILYDQYINIPGSLTHPTTIIAYIIICFAALFAFCFGYYVFYPKQKTLVYLFIFLYGTMALLLFLHLITDPFDNIPNALPVRWMIFQYLFVIISIIGYSIIFVEGLRLTLKQNDPKIKWPLVFLTLYPISVIAGFVSLSADLLTGVAYSPFYFLGWSCFFISLMLAYIGFIVPPWFRKLIHANNDH